MDSPTSRELVELRRERDEAQSEVQAWVHVVDGLAAHIMDRAENGDPASPETYLAILQSDVAQLKLSSAQICAARWADYKRLTDSIESLQQRIERLETALVKCAEPHRWHAPCSSCGPKIVEQGCYIARAALAASPRSDVLRETLVALPFSPLGAVRS